jgi:hypothetical protein
VSQRLLGTVDAHDFHQGKHIPDGWSRLVVSSQSSCLDDAGHVNCARGQQNTTCRRRSRGGAGGATFGIGSVDGRQDAGVRGAAAAVFFTTDVDADIVIVCLIATIATAGNGAAAADATVRSGSSSSIAIDTANICPGWRWRCCC